MAFWLHKSITSDEKGCMLVSACSSDWNTGLLTVGKNEEEELREEEAVEGLNGEKGGDGDRNESRNRHN